MSLPEPPAGAGIVDNPGIYKPAIINPKFYEDWTLKFGTYKLYSEATASCRKHKITVVWMISNNGVLVVVIVIIIAGPRTLQLKIVRQQIYF